MAYPYSNPAATAAEEHIWQALEEVKDPEIPVVSVVGMGIVREVSLEHNQVRVRFTPTFSGCPALEVMRRDIRERLEQLGFAPEAIAVETMLSPPWSSDWIRDDAREALWRYGIAPPEKSGGSGLMQLESPPPACPRCGSLQASLKNSFGPTLCKAIYVCQACLEPFEAFKQVG